MFIDSLGRKVTPPWTYKSHGRGKLRRAVMVRYPDGKRKTTSYARWLMEHNIGKELDPSVTVDHDDENPLNDTVENYNLMSLADNIRKSAKPIEWFYFDCPNCGKPSKKEARNVRHNQGQGKAGPFCGKSCAVKWSIKTGSLKQPIHHGNPIHGTDNCYSYHGCRCSLCTEAHREEARRYRASKRPI